MAAASPAGSNSSFDQIKYCVPIFYADEPSQQYHYMKLDYMRNPAETSQYIDYDPQKGLFNGTLELIEQIPFELITPEVPLEKVEKLLKSHRIALAFFREHPLREPGACPLICRVVIPEQRYPNKFHKHRDHDQAHDCDATRVRIDLIYDREKVAHPYSGDFYDTFEAYKPGDPESERLLEYFFNSLKPQEPTRKEIEAIFKKMEKFIISGDDAAHYAEQAEAQARKAKEAVNRYNESLAAIFREHFARGPLVEDPKPVELIPARQKKYNAIAISVTAAVSLVVCAAAYQFFA